MYDFFNEEAVRLNEGFSQDHKIKYFAHYKSRGDDIVEVHDDIARVSGVIHIVARLRNSDKTTRVDKNAPFFKNIGKYKTKYSDEELAVYAANLRDVKEKLKDQYKKLGGDIAYQLAMAVKEQERMDYELRLTRMEMRRQK